MLLFAPRPSHGGNMTFEDQHDIQRTGRRDDLSDRAWGLIAIVSVPLVAAFVAGVAVGRYLVGG